jgi:serine/threonine-protein kinase
MLSNEPGGKSKLIALPDGKPFTIGRGKASSFCVTDLKMSRQHCEITVSGGVTIITDLGSMNGTHVNAKQVASTALQDGDLIQVGYTRFRFHAGELGKRGGSRRRSRAAGGHSSDNSPAVPAAPPPLAPKTAPQAAASRPAVAARRSGAGACRMPLPGGPEDEQVGRTAATDDESLASRLRIVMDETEARLKRGELLCSSCRQAVSSRDLKSGSATNIHGQVCCPSCIAADPLIGRTIVGYRVDVKLGAGAWSSTYKAEQLSMARSVVLRVLRPEVATDSERAAQFLAAVKRGGQISHPNLVRIYDIGRADAICYVSGEYIDGDNFGRRFADGPLPMRDAADVVLAVAGAVDVAHRREVFHRDIRPGNIILNDEDIPKLVGLGFAKSLEDVAAAGGIEVRHTPDLLRYWAPECVFDPTTATRAADVYALGAVLYHALSGEPPFTATEPVALVRSIREFRPHPLDTVRREIPQRLAAVVAKTLAKAPDDRYDTCHSFIRDLRASLS